MPGSGSPARGTPGAARRVVPRLDRIPSRSESGAVHVVVESPRGSATKLRFDPRLGVFAVSRPLPIGVTYPFDWGFVPSTLAPDGDPLDGMIVADAASWPGTLVACRPIGVVRVTQKAKEARRRSRERNDRVIFVPERDPRYDDARSVPLHVREGLERFFVLAVLTEEKQLGIEGWHGPDEAERLIRAAERARRRR